MFDIKGLIDAMVRRVQGDPSDRGAPTQMIALAAKHEYLSVLLAVVKEASELNRNTRVKLKDRMRSLQYYDEKLLAVTHVLTEVYRGRESVDGVSAKQVLPGLLACWQELASGYKYCLREFADNPIRGAEEAIHVSALRAAEFYQRQALWSHVRYFEPEPRVLRNLHQVYLFAEARNVAQTPLRWTQSERESATVEGVYLRAMLLSAAEPARRLPEQVWQIHDWLAHWVPLVRIDRTIQPREQVFALNLDEARPPMRLRRNMVGERYRYLDTTALATSVAALAAHARQGLMDAQLGKVETRRQGVTVQLLSDLAVVWSRDGQSRRRRFERNTVSRQAEVASGLANVARLLGGSGTVNLDGIAVGSRGFEMVEWTLADESSSGFGANFRSRFEDPLNVGELVAVREEAGKRPTVGIVRRLIKNREGQVQVGIEKLGSHPVLVTLSDGSAQRPALYSQDAPQCGGQRGLLLESALYAEHRELPMSAGSKSYRIRLGAPVEVLSSYTLCGFLVVDKS